MNPLNSHKPLSVQMDLNSLADSNLDSMNNQLQRKRGQFHSHLSHPYLKNVLLAAVFELLVMGGGNQESVVDWTILTPDGSECTGHDLPNLPDTVMFAGMAPAYDRFVVLCGGYKSSSYSEFYRTFTMFRAIRRKFLHCFLTYLEVTTGYMTMGLEA